MYHLVPSQEAPSLQDSPPPSNPIANVLVTGQIRDSLVIAIPLARAEGGQPVLNFAPANVAALLRTLTETRVVQVPESAVIATDADSLTQILLNLIENAIAYTDHWLAEVGLVEQGDGICITGAAFSLVLPLNHAAAA